MLRKFSFCLFLILFLLISPLHAQTQLTTPERGGAERKAIIDALRAPVRKQLGKDVIFKIDHLKTQNGWAFLRGVPQQPDGTEMDYTGTIYGQRIAEGAFDNWICALLRKQNGKWRVVKFVIGATDVVYEGWDVIYKAPSSIFR
ncbi:MAG: hypothetical protein H0V88_05825 [Pyrinomonadaceae bacterium]|nr:hypothetical protein [Pyrinomonadaceae bacterium]